MCAGLPSRPRAKTVGATRWPLSQAAGLDRALPGHAAEEFWVIKHGIKMSAMPAWGALDDDSSIWAIVAFVRSSELTPERYQAVEPLDNHPIIITTT